MEQIYSNYNILYGDGSNIYGQLGLGDFKYNINNNILTKILFNYSVKSVSCGDYHTIIIDGNNELWSFGYNKFGQLGLEDNNNKKIPTKIEFNYKVKSVSCGEFHTIIIDENDELWGFGNNYHGQLGLGVGNNDSINIPTKIEFNYKVKSISCGRNHTIIIDENDYLWSFGDNRNGQLGLNYYLGSKYSNNRNIPIKIEFNYKVKSVSCGGAHTIIIDENDYLWSFGCNDTGQLGIKIGYYIDIYIPTKIAFNHKVKSVSCGNDHTIIIDENDKLWAFGDKNYGQLGLGDIKYDIDIDIPTKIPFNYKVKSVSCGNIYTTIIDENNEIWSFGCNRDGQLGLGDTDNINIPTKIAFNDKVKSISCGKQHTLIILL
uniref:Regulator of chromosome condensation protein n=1 Tax=Pithovirus LCPAC102 TaxID=2506587 RepID=A0A481Z4Z7_9VIRU|nr:MAG: regulator of chromosome condensation protein [Pithovirus LCPAC102]